MFVSRQFFLSRTKMLGFLNELEATADIAGSLYLPSGLPSPEVGNLVARVADLQAVPVELAKLATVSETGAVIFWSQLRTYLITPPFPIRTEYFARGYVVEPLCSLLKRNFRIALILIRLGAYAIGLSEGESLVTSKVGTGLIHGRHKKGGSSQQRFARHREKQIEYFLSRVCGHIRDHLEPHASTVDFVVYGGARTTITLLRKQCPVLARFDDDILPPLLDIPEPRQPVLEKAIRRVWSTSVIEWRDDEVPA
jgi:peptide subunit release factor 1 (eRF1)